MSIPLHIFYNFIALPCGIIISSQLSSFLCASMLDWISLGRGIFLRNIYLLRVGAYRHKVPYPITLPRKPCFSWILSIFFTAEIVRSFWNIHSLHAISVLVMVYFFVYHFAQVYTINNTRMRSMSNVRKRVAKETFAISSKYEMVNLTPTWTITKSSSIPTIFIASRTFDVLITCFVGILWGVFVSCFIQSRESKDLGLVRPSVIFFTSDVIFFCRSFMFKYLEIDKGISTR